MEIKIQTTFKKTYILELIKFSYLTEKEIHHALKLIEFKFKTEKEVKENTQIILAYLTGVHSGFRIMDENIKSYSESVNTGGLTEGKDCDASRISYNT